MPNIDMGIDEVMCILGTKEVEIIALRRALAQAEARIKELTAPAEGIAPPNLAAVPKA